MHTSDSAIEDVLLRLESWSAFVHPTEGNIRRLDGLVVVLKDWEPTRADQFTLAHRSMEWIDDAMMELKTAGGLERELDPELVGRIIHTQRRLGAAAGHLPDSTTLLDDIEVEDDEAVSGGGGSVYQGVYNKHVVAIKCLHPRDVSEENRKIWKSYSSEAMVWKYLIHPNIVPFMGVSNIIPMSLVSLWMPNGTLLNHLKENPDESRLFILSDITSGLAYLHALNIVHSDLKCRNIMVDDSGNACLTDFGVSQLLHTTSNDGQVTTVRGTVPFMAPELLAPIPSDEDDIQATKQSDMWSLACVFWEIFTLREPFRGLPPYGIYLKLENDERLPRPSGSEAPELSDQVWESMRDCWAFNPELRPDAAHMCGVVEGLLELRHHDQIAMQLNMVEAPELHQSIPLQQDLHLNVGGLGDWDKFWRKCRYAERTLYTIASNGQHVVMHHVDEVSIYTMCPAGLTERIAGRLERDVQQQFWPELSNPFACSHNGRLWAELVQDNERGCSLIEVRPVQKTGEEYPPIMTSSARQVRDMAFTLDGRSLVAFCYAEEGQSTCYLHVYEVETGILTASISAVSKHRRKRRYVSISRDSKFAIVSNDYEIMVFCLSPAALTLHYTKLTRSIFPESVTGTPNDLRWARRLDEGELTVHRLRAGLADEVQVVNKNSWALGAAFSPDMSLLGVYNDHRDLGLALYIVDEGMQPFRQLRPGTYLDPWHPLNTIYIVFPDDHPEFVICSNGENTRLWHIPSGTLAMETDRENPLVMDYAKYEHFVGRTEVPEGWLSWLFGQ